MTAISKFIGKIRRIAVSRMGELKKESSNKLPYSKEGGIEVKAKIVYNFSSASESIIDKKITIP